VGEGGLVKVKVTEFTKLLFPRKKYPKTGGIFCMGAQTRTDILPYISIIPVFGYFFRGSSSTRVRGKILGQARGR